MAGPKTAGGRSAAAGPPPGGYGQNPVLWPQEELRSKLKRGHAPKRLKMLGQAPVLLLPCGRSVKINTNGDEQPSLDDA